MTTTTAPSPSPEGPDAREAGVPDDLAAAYRAAAATFRDPRPSTATRWAPLIVASALVVFASPRGEGWVFGAATMLAVLCLFDVGPWVASRLFGLPSPHALLPFWRRRAGPASEEPWKLGLALLLGPLPVACWGLGLAIASLQLEAPALMRAAGLFGLTSFFALLPLAPASGGVLLRLVVFSRWPRLEQAFAVVSGAAMALLGLEEGLNVLTAVGLLAALGALSIGPTLVEASKLRAAHPALSSQPEALGEVETGALFLAADRTFTPARQSKAREGGAEAERAAALYAARMRTLHARAVLKPPRVASSAALLALYLLGLVAATCLLALAFGRPDDASPTIDADRSSAAPPAG